MIAANARNGAIFVEMTDVGKWEWEYISRKDAVMLIGELANAILQSGDYSDPEAQDFVASVQRAIKTCALS